MSQGNRQFSLTYEQRLLLDVYINFYNQTTRQIDNLHDLQREIIENINEITSLSSHERTRFTHNERPYYSPFNTNRHQQQHRQNNQNTSNRRNNQNRNERARQAEQTQVSQNNSRVVYIEGVPYLLDLTNFMRIRNSNNNNTNRDAANLWRTFNDNIIVAPTRTQIENSTRILQFSEITSPINSSCPISLERFDETTSVMQILHCGHIFTPSGIESWFQSNVRCPVCRYDIRDYLVQDLPATTASREERNRRTEQGIESAEENNEDEAYEETKDDTPLPSTRNNNESTNERLSNLNSQNRQNTSQNNRRITSENVTNVLSNITEEILNNILQPNGGSRTLFDPSHNSLFYDSSNNQFIFEGFMRR